MTRPPAGSDLVYSATRQGDALVLGVRGEIDLHNSPEFRVRLLQELNGAPIRRLVLDMLQVPYMDSSALAVLVEMMRIMMRRGGKIGLAGLQPRVKGLLEIARLSTLFTIYANTEEALGEPRRT